MLKPSSGGIGSRLMDVAEEIAAGYADVVYLGVGLHSGYGSAQRISATIPSGMVIVAPVAITATAKSL